MGEFVIPPEQYEQDMQAEDEQYIQAGNDGLSGQQQLALLKKEFQKKYPCEFCHKRFLCFICLKGFTQRVHLNTHKKHSHPGQEGVEGGEGGEDMDTEGSEEGSLAIAEH